jgi:hypothetical protein
MSFRTTVFLAGLIAVMAVTTSCSRSAAPPLERENLFSLSYGKMEDQVELYLDGSAVRRKIRLVMSNGLFYVSSGYGNRVMELTSFGDLLTLFYNPVENPRPVMLDTGEADDRIMNRRAYEHSFNRVGEIAVTRDNILLVEDQVPDRTAVFDEELGTLLNRIIVRLDSSGRQIDYLGQEGIGGTFFPFIQNIHVTSRNEIVVLATAPEVLRAYWYSNEGILLRRVDITHNSLPMPAEFASEPVLESVFPDQELRRLYLKVNYVDRRAAQTGEGTAPRMISRVYWIDVSDGSYQGFVDVPRNLQSDSLLGGLGEEQEFYYELVGTAPGEHLFLLSQESTTQSQLLILKTSGQVVRRRTLEIDYADVVLSDFHLSRSGILTALLATRESVDIAWWRTDRLFEAGQL